MKKLVSALLMTAVMSGPAMAIQAPEGVEVPWSGSATAYSSEEFNERMEAYGLTLTSEATQAVWGLHATACIPAVYHSILTAYGLELTPEEVNAKLGSISYASVKDGKIVFGSLSTAYNQTEWVTILSAYGKIGTGDEDGDGVADDQDACPGTPKNVTVDERGCWSHPTHMLFDFDKAQVKEAYYSGLNEAKLVLDAQPGMTIQIDGYTCNVGPEAYNQGLSERRASAVQDYLVNKAGIDPARLSIKGYGEMKPAYPNDTKANRQKNRRVEFTPSM